MQLIRAALDKIANRFHGSYRQLYAMYLLTFLLPLIVTVLLSEMATNVLERQIQSSATAMTAQVQTTIDSRLGDVSRLIDQINNHSTLRYLLNRETPLTYNDRYMVATIINDLRKQYSYHTIVEDLFIYMPGMDAVLTTQARVDSAFFYGTYFAYENMDYDQWMAEYMDAYHDMRVLPAQNVFDGTQTRRIITVLQSLPRGDTWRKTGTLVLLIDEDWLTSQVAPMRMIEGSEVLAVAGDGTVVFSSNPGAEVAFDAGSLTGEGFFTEGYRGKPYQLSYIHAQAQDWTYVYRYPKDTFFAMVDQLRMTMRGALFVVVGIGLLLAGLLAYINLLPMNNILSTIQETDSKDMLKRLRRRISFSDVGTLMEHALKSNAAFASQLPKLIENCVFKMIHGNRDVESDLSLLQEVLGFRFPSNVFATMCYRLPDGDEHDMLALYGMTREVIQGMQEREDAGMNLYCTLATENTVAVFVSFWAGQAEGFRPLLAERAQALFEGLAQRTGRRYPLGVSLVVDSYEEVNNCYRQAVMAMAGAGAQEQVVFYADIARVVVPIDYSYPLETEKVLIGCVLTGDTKRMQKIIDDIFHHHREESRLSLEMVRCLKYDLLGTLYKCMQELQGDQELQNQEQLAALIRRLMESDVMLDIYECFLEAFEGLCMQAYKEKRSHNDALCDSILAFIRANFNHPDMGLDMVARAFDIAPGYLSRFIKENSGSGFLDFLNKLRIEHAAYLLRTTDMPHNEVAEACGLSGPQSLNRLFNRILSLSPSVYRQMARDGLFSGEIIG